MAGFARGLETLGFVFVDELGNLEDSVDLNGAEDGLAGVLADLVA